MTNGKGLDQQLESTKCGVSIGRQQHATNAESTAGFSDSIGRCRLAFHASAHGGLLSEDVMSIELEILAATFAWSLIWSSPSYVPW
eukprot:scaffold19_cov114-Cylindrotheca_fusiformis.AAC.5